MEQVHRGAKLAGRFEGSQRGLVIGLGGNFGNDFFVDYFALAVEHNHGAGQQLEFIDHDAPGLAELARLVVAADLHVLDIFGTAEAVLRKRQVSADRQGVDLIPQAGQLLAKAFGLDLADAGIQAGNDGNDGRLALEIRVGQRLEPALEVVQRELGCGLADLELAPLESHGSSFEGDYA